MSIATTSGALSQTDRMGRLDTPLGQDKLVLVRFEADEGMSELFEYRIDALSRDENIDFDKLTGRNCCVTLKTYNDAKRCFNGVLVEAQWVGVQQNLYAYRLVLRPWFWLLSRRADCKIFKDMSCIDIVEEVFKKAGFNDFEVKVSRGDYAKIEYCVQYRETDLAFVSRLMEEWGVYTFFDHTSDKHKLILADSRSCHVPMTSPPGGVVAFIPLAERDRRDRQHIYHWSSERRFRTGKMSTNDFDYMKPATPIDADAQGTESYEKSKLEQYDYPGRYTEKDIGQKRAKVRLEAEQAMDRRKYAAGDAAGLYPGALFTMKQHPTDDGQYIVVRCTHSFVSEAYTSGVSAAEAEEAYHGHYELLKSDRPFRAPLLTPKPLVHGPQTAIVTTRKGKESEEIDVDDEGRIFVQFHWNREKKEKYSLPVRVAQMWSGKSWGWQVIPRKGQEVVVDFLEGDPDQPLVVGTVYNKDYPYPYPLPDKKNISGVKSDSTKGPNKGYNEFIFDDTAGKELIGTHAQYDMDSVVEHDETRNVKHDRTTKIDNDDSKNVHNNWTVEVGQKVYIKAGTEITLECGTSKITMKPESISIESSDIKITATMNITEKASFILLN